MTPPVDAGRSLSRVAPPARAIDCHAHSYDPVRYPFAGSSSFYLPANEIGTAEHFRAVLDSHGFTHAVLINPIGGYGVDNRYLLEAVAAGAGAFRGIALLDPEASDRDVATLVAGGIVGLRFNLDFPLSPSLYGEAGARALAVARENRWILQVHYEGDTILDALPVLRGADLPVVIDHCGRPALAGGIGSPGFQALLAYGREGRAFIKLSGAFRISTAGPPYRDCDPVMAALIDAFGIERCLWGSDWPFVRARYRVDYGPLLTCLRRVVPDVDDQDRVLWRNPARLFGFEGGRAPEPARSGPGYAS